VTSGDRRSHVAERFGKKSQAQLWSCFQARQAHGVCPAPCGGDCLPANPPGRSSHELCSDGVAFAGPAGRELPWWQLGLDVSESDKLLHVLTALGYGVRRPYNTPSEFHHVNFTRDPGPVIAGQREGDGHSPVPRPKRPRPVVTHTGPDVSDYQGDIDWKEVRHAGHAFAFVKATEGRDYVDPRFGPARWAAMHAAGIRRGAYHFARPQSGRPASMEANHFLSAVHQAGGFAAGDLPPVLDLEWSRGLGSSALRAWAMGWLDHVRKATGVKPLLYTGEWFWHGALGDSHEPLDYPLWLAAYVRDPRPFVPPPWRHTGPVLWQYTDRAHCPGIAGPCDMSRFRGDPASFRRLGF
jgi:lysozyme